MAEQHPEQNGNNHVQSGSSTPDLPSRLISRLTHPASPNESHSLSSTGLYGNESVETLLSSDDATEVGSNPSIFYPPPPVNTPATQSLAGDMGAMNLTHADEQLAPGDATPEPNAGEGKAHLRTRVRSDVPLLRQLFKQPPKSLKRVAKMTKNTHIGPAAEPQSAHFHEHTTWITLAKEDIARGLERLARAAKDLYKIDESVSVEQYYNENLGEVLKAAEIKFDEKVLQ